MMPIAVLEAMSSGVPAIANQHPVLEWIIGADKTDVQRAGGKVTEMSKNGALMECLCGVSSEWSRGFGQRARERAILCYGKDVVMDRIINMYEDVYAGTE
jgi:glycosyltransferase involved in cell wall biosynthesis